MADLLDVNCAAEGGFLAVVPFELEKGLVGEEGDRVEEER